jgi:hypothetical protein
MKHPDTIFHLLFDVEDGPGRIHWKTRPFRVLYQQAVTELCSMQNIGQVITDQFKLSLRRNLYKYHWILPSPTPATMIHRAKVGHKIMWYSMKRAPLGMAAESPLSKSRETRKGVTDTAVKVREIGREWVWAKKSWQAGTPEQFPSMLDWSKEEWQDWIMQQQSE